MSMVGFVQTGRVAISAGKSHSCERPTWLGVWPSAWTISVALEISETIRGTVNRRTRNRRPHGERRTQPRWAGGTSGRRRRTSETRRSRRRDRLRAADPPAAARRIHALRMTRRASYDRYTPAARAARRSRSRAPANPWARPKVETPARALYPPTCARDTRECLLGTNL